jgi:hypothetical protein
MKQPKYLLVLIAMTVFWIMTVSSQAQTCYPNDVLPNDYVAFSQIYYITAPNTAGDRLVVGKMTLQQLTTFLNSVPLPNQPNQKFCDPVELAPGLFAIAYVPTPSERLGDFSSFGVPLIDPFTNFSFLNNIIPGSRLGDPHAWRISGFVLVRGSLQTIPILPDVIHPGFFIFLDTRTGTWVDPPAAFGFKYTMTSSSLFTEILDFPVGFDGLFTVSVGGTLIGMFGPGQSVTFPDGGVTEFTVTGIKPPADINNPIGFPLKLAFNTPRASFTMRALNIEVDIKPGNFLNSINPRSNGVIPVAILTTDTFNASIVDPATVRFGANGTEASPAHYAFEDVDGDGDLDLLLHFKTQETGIVCGTISASLTGNTSSAEVIGGADSINTVGCK